MAILRITKLMLAMSFFVDSLYALFLLQCSSIPATYHLIQQTDPSQPTKLMILGPACSLASIVMGEIAQRKLHISQVHEATICTHYIAVLYIAIATICTHYIAVLYSYSYNMYTLHSCTIYSYSYNMYTLHSCTI